MCPHKSNPPSPRTTPLLRLPLLDFNGGLKKGFHGNCTLCAHCMQLMLCTWCRMDAFHQTAGWKSCFSLKWWVSLWDGRMNLCLILHYVERLDHEWGSAHVEEERDVCVGGQGFCEQTLNTLLRKNGTFVLVDRGFVSKHSIRSWGRMGRLCWWRGVLWANTQYALEEERDVCVGGQGFCEQTLNTLLRKNGTFVLVDRGFVSKHSIRSWGRTGRLCWWTGVLWANTQYALEEERDVCVGGQGFCEQTLNTLLRKNGTFALVDRGFVSKRSIRSEQWWLTCSPKLQALVYDILGGRCRKVMLRVWRKVPESDARSMLLSLTSLLLLVAL